MALKISWVLSEIPFSWQRMGKWQFILQCSGKNHPHYVEYMNYHIWAGYRFSEKPIVFSDRYQPAQTAQMCYGIAKWTRTVTGYDIAVLDAKTFDS